MHCISQTKISVKIARILCAAVAHADVYWLRLTDVCWIGLLASSVYVLKRFMMSAAQTRTPTSRSSMIKQLLIKVFLACVCVCLCVCGLVS